MGFCSLPCQKKKGSCNDPLDTRFHHDPLDYIVDHPLIRRLHELRSSGRDVEGVGEVGSEGLSVVPDACRAMYEGKLRVFRWPVYVFD